MWNQPKRKMTRPRLLSKCPKTSYRPKLEMLEDRLALTAAYVVPAATVGNQTFAGALGMDFDVVQDISVPRLGVFDSGGNGLNSPISVRLYNRDTQAEVASVLNNSGTTGSLVGGSRFYDLATPLVLSAGFHGTIVAEGYGPSELNGNETLPGAPSVSTDSGGGLISFVGSGRFGNAGSFPSMVLGANVNPFAAGTFDFTLPGASEIGVPSVTDATTNEDTQTTSGLVITRNAADGNEVTHFQITNITNGKLFLNDGTTQIVNGSFITVAQGNAGLKFTPNSNFFGTSSFNVQASLSASDVGLGGSVATATITVNPVADTPSLTNSTTIENTQTTSGLVISRNAVDSTEVTHFKITNITNGTLFLNNGTTPIANGTFITFAQGAAGLKFTPSNGFFGTGSFDVQASQSNSDADLGGSVVTASITVNGVANTPSVTNATTNEDTQSTSGLVITRNAADGNEVTHFKVTNINNGTLFLNNGTTQIVNGSFITVAQGNAGLKFTPSSNFFGTGSFGVQASVSATDAGLGGSVATATITINPVADTPSVTNAATTVNTQTTSGLVVSRNAVDSTEVTHFKITNITNGTLFQNDGTTPIANGTFITFAQGNAGLKFTPSNGFFGTGSFDVQASQSNSDADLGGSVVTATITVNVASALSTTTTLSSSDNNSLPGQDVTFTATVSVVGGTPTGTVTFKIDGSGGGVVPVDGVGQASFSTSTLTLGSHTITADYASNNPSFSDSSAAPLTQTVSQVATTTLLVSSDSTSSLGQPVTFTATVASAEAGLIPTGTVTFFVAGNNVVVPLDGSGQASFSTSTLPIGTFTANAAYTSNSIVFLDSTSPPITQTVTGELAECTVETLNSPGSPGTATLEDDADNPGSGVLIVTGTAGNDTIVVERSPRNRSQLLVLRNGRAIGTFNFADVQHIVAFGLAGNDRIIVSAGLSQPATLFGDEGNDYLYGAKGADGLEGGGGVDRLFGGSNNDTLCGGDGNDFVYGQAGNDFAGGDAGNDKVFGEGGNDFLLGNDGNDQLYGGTGNDRAYGQAGNDQVFGETGNDIGVGGDGNDKLFGGSGRDVLIGGDGLDILFGEAHDDILVAGSTSHDEDDEALLAILAEWTSANGYTTRVNNIRSGGGANGAFTLDDTTVIDDGLVDTLWGDGGLDWFLFGDGDKLKDKASNELVN